VGKMQWQATMSLDGFISGPGGDMSWLTEHLGPNPTVDEVIGKVGALLVGNRTFRGDDPYKGTTKEGEPYGGDGPDHSSCLPTTPRTLRCRVSPSSVTSTAVSPRPRPRVRLFDRPGGTTSSSNASV
jgi:hypothetical protein